MKFIWAKTKKFVEKTNCQDDDLPWHPLVLHLLDAAVVAELILDRESETTRERFAKIFGLPWSEAKNLVLLLVACHDIGKACPAFQLKWQKSKELLRNYNIKIPKGVDTRVRHGSVSQVIITDLLTRLGWDFDFASLCADAVGCHHGIRVKDSELDKIRYVRSVDIQGWREIHQNIFNSLQDILCAYELPKKTNLSGDDYILLAGLTSFADWIASNETYFSYGRPEDTDDLRGWVESRRHIARGALDAIGWYTRNPLKNEFQSFETAFPECSPPRPLQKCVSEIVQSLTSPAVLLIEAPMGEGKTEAAFFSHQELQRKFKHRGLYVAMPSQATGNAMFERTVSFLSRNAGSRKIDIQLVHGKSSLNSLYDSVRLNQIHSEDGKGSLHASEWFTPKKRSLLSEYGVGTVDQAILSILPCKHYFVRLWGLANRVVIFDEIHAYDTYTGTLLISTVKWLRALGSSVILLSATLPPRFRKALAKALGLGIPADEKPYPRITLLHDSLCKQISFEADPSRSQELQIKGISPSFDQMRLKIDSHCPSNGYVGVIVNTVQRAQEFYLSYGPGEQIALENSWIGKKLQDGTEIYLFHARFPAEERKKREEAILSIYGKNQSENGFLPRFGKKIIIATQVVEQSLDLDFDLMLTDLAPIDLVLQRAGRLWRHKRTNRPTASPYLYICGLGESKPGCFGAPLWWNAVYQEDILLLSWMALKRIEQNSSIIKLPDDIDCLVREVYESEGRSEDESLQKRLDQASCASDGKRGADRGLAIQSDIGSPHDGSWILCYNIASYDPEDLGVHNTLKVKTRLGEESVNVIPIQAGETFDPLVEPEISIAKNMLLRAVSLSKKNVVTQFREMGVPKGWEKNPFLRNCYPMILDGQGVWQAMGTVRLDKELGIVYEDKNDN